MGITGLCTPTPVTFLFLALARVGQRMLKLDILPLVETLLIFCCQELLHAWVPPRVGWGGLGVPKAEGPCPTLRTSPITQLPISTLMQGKTTKKMQKYPMQKFALLRCISTVFLFFCQLYFLKSIKSAPHKPHPSTSHINI